MPTVQTNDVEAYYERTGDGPPLVFVHGAALDYDQWEPQVETLAEEYTTITYDVRGHGRTGGSARRRYSMELLASDLDQLIESLDLDRPVVCGHSMGGCIAQVYAAERSDRLSGLVLADTFSPPHLTWGEWLQRSALLRAAIPPVRLVGYRRVERALVWLRERLHGAGVSGDYEQIRSVRATGPRMTTTEFAKVIRAVARYHETFVDLRSIDVPTLIVYGEHETSFVRRHAPRLAYEIPNAAVQEVPDAGRASNLDNPNFFSTALQAFLFQLDVYDATDRVGDDEDEEAGAE
jgi:pimeloyl-ACP methyl ester carboxylesterase